MRVDVMNEVLTDFGKIIGISVNEAYEGNVSRFASHPGWRVSVGRAPPPPPCRDAPHDDRPFALHVPRRPVRVGKRLRPLRGASQQRGGVETEKPFMGRDVTRCGGDGNDEWVRVGGPARVEGDL